MKESATHACMRGSETNKICNVHVGAGRQVAPCPLKEGGGCAPRCASWWRSGIMMAARGPHSRFTSLSEPRTLNHHLGAMNVPRGCSKKRKQHAESLESERSLYSAFSHAANAVSQLYTAAVQQTKRAEEQGARQALVSGGRRPAALGRSGARARRALLGGCSLGLKRRRDKT